MGTFQHLFHILATLKSPQSQRSQEIHGFKSSQVKYYLWTDFVPCVTLVTNVSLWPCRQADRMHLWGASVRFETSLLDQKINAEAEYLLVCGSLDYSSISYSEVCNASQD